MSSSISSTGDSVTLPVSGVNDGSVAEVFINAVKTGTTLESMGVMPRSSPQFAYGTAGAVTRFAMRSRANGDTSASGVLGALLDLLATPAPTP